MAKHRSARSIANSLKHTANRYHAGSIDHATMSIRNRRNWEEAERTGQVEAVSEILRAWRMPRTRWT